MTTQTLVELDPKLLVDDGNIRTKAGDIDGMAESIKSIGVVSPLIVVTQNGGFRVIAGTRRRAAAIKAGLDVVPCIVRDDLSGLSQQSLMAIENLQRKDLTVMEEADAYAQLALSGLDAATIAATTGLDVKRVESSTKVAASKVATAVTEKHDLTLEQALVLAEFDDDKEAVKKLTVTAVKEPRQFDHVVSRMRQERDERLAIAKLTDELIEQGVTQCTKPIAWSGMDGPRRLSDLTVDGKKRLTVAAHKKCPGHAAVVKRADWQHKTPFIDYVCMAPGKNGHKGYREASSRSSSTPAAGTDEAEATKAARRATIEGNKAWRAAEPVRQTFVDALLKTSPTKLPKHTLGYIVQAAISSPYNFGRGADIDFAAIKAAEKDPTLWTRVLLTRVANDIEGEMDVMTWRKNEPRREAAWFTFLASAGYALSDIEQKVIDIAKKAGR